MPRRSRPVRRRAIVLAFVLLSASGSRALAQTQDEFFDDARLQDVRLVVSTRDWQNLKEHAAEDLYYPADVKWNGVTVRNVGIRSRGGASRNGIKPGLRVDINHYVTNQEFLGMKAFVLDNMYSDGSLMRETVTMKMFARMGVPAPREAHARLYINDEYAGAYVIIEAIDRTFISRVFGAQEGNVETGGYLFEYQYAFPYYFEYLGPELEAYAPLFRPQTRDTDSMANIYGPIEEMIRTINEAPDEMWVAVVGKYLDLHLAMKYLAVETFMVDWDGLVGNIGANNFYLYRSRQDGRAQFIPKDKDAGLALVDDQFALRFDIIALARRATAIPELREEYLDWLRQCAAKAGEPAADDGRGWLEREVDRQTALVTPAIADDPVFPFTFDEFLGVVPTLVEFAQDRASFVTCEVAQMEGSPESSECAVPRTFRKSKRR
jgi:CotH kinase protein